MPVDAPLQTGTVLISRYRIVKLLGQGGFGAVYKAWDTRLNAPCAVKENFEIGEEGTRQFAREATILANLHHPNLPRVNDHFSIQGQAQYLVMEYIEGEDLQTKLDRAGGPLPESQVLPWIEQVCDALTYLHTRMPPIIHRDLKPANIRICPDGKAMLVDFGIAKLYDPLKRTTMGARAVTPGYAPFEQYGQEPTDARTDVYALGATLYAASTGQTPVESIGRVGGRLLPDPRSLNPTISAPTEALILKAMALLPDQRFQSASEFKRELSAFSGQPSVVGGQPPAARNNLTTPQLAKPYMTVYPPAASQTAALGPASAPVVERRHLSWVWIGVSGGVLALALIVATLAIGMSYITGQNATRTAIALDANRTGTAARLTADYRSPTPTPTLVPTRTLTPTITFTPTVANTPTPKLDIGSTQVSSKDGMVLVYVPAGEFSMGSNEKDNEKPIHTVYLDAFWIDQTEVTNAMYALCVRMGACQSPQETKSWTRSDYFVNSQYNNFPVIHVSWNDARNYCQWAGRQLPTEAQWEKAARGTDGRKYPWGETISCTQANYGGVDGCEGDTVAVGSYSNYPSPYGAYDMAGNVCEWVADWYDASYYASSPGSNPIGPVTGHDKVLRGGSWFESSEVDVRAADRMYFIPGYSYYDFGFRCAVFPEK